MSRGTKEHTGTSQAQQGWCPLTPGAGGGSALLTQGSKPSAPPPGQPRGPSLFLTGLCLLVNLQNTSQLSCKHHQEETQICPEQPGLWCFAFEDLGKFRSQAQHHNLYFSRWMLISGNVILTNLLAILGLVPRNTAADNFPPQSVSGFPGYQSPPHICQLHEPGGAPAPTKPSLGHPGVLTGRGEGETGPHRRSC